MESQERHSNVMVSLRAPQTEALLDYDEVVERFANIGTTWVNVTGGEGSICVTWDIDIPEEIKLGGFTLWFLRRVTVPHENPLKPDKEEWLEVSSTKVAGKRRKYTMRNLPPASIYRVEIRPMTRVLHNYVWVEVNGISRVSDSTTTERNLVEEWETVHISDGTYLFYNVITGYKVQKTKRKGGRKWHATGMALGKVSFSIGYFRNEVDAANACLEQSQKQQKIYNMYKTRF